MKYYMSLRFQHENLGEYLIISAAINLLAESGEVFLDRRGVPDNVVALLGGIRNVRLTTRSFLKTLISEGPCVYVVKPGAYFAYKSFRAKAKVALMYVYFGVSRLFGAKFVKLPHSYSSSGVGRLEKYFYKMFDLVLCRDAATKEFYLSIGVKNTHLFPDMSSYYFAKENSFVGGVKVSRSGAVVSLRHDRPNALKALEDVISQKGLSLSAVVSQVSFDDEINDRFHAACGVDEFVKFDLTSSSVNAILDKYQSSRYVISNRLHALLIGYMNGAIPIALVDKDSDAKIVGCLTEFGMADNVFDVADFLGSREWPTEAKKQSRRLEFDRFRSLLDAQFIE